MTIGCDCPCTLNVTVPLATSTDWILPVILTVSFVVLTPAHAVNSAINNRPAKHIIPMRKRFNSCFMCFLLFDKLFFVIVIKYDYTILFWALLCFMAQQECEVIHWNYVIIS